MDPFSITASTIGITMFATKSIEQLHSLIEGLSEAQDVVADISTSLANLERPLATLQGVGCLDEATSMTTKEYLNKTSVAEADNACGAACDEFGKNLKKWTKSSSNSKLSLRDRLSVGVWNKAKVRTFKTQVQSCETTVQFAVTTAQL